VVKRAPFDLSFLISGRNEDKSLAERIGSHCSLTVWPLLVAWNSDSKYILLRVDYGLIRESLIFAAALILGAACMSTWQLVSTLIVITCSAFPGLSTSSPCVGKRNDLAEYCTNLHPEVWSVIHVCWLGHYDLDLTYQRPGNPMMQQKTI